MKIVIAPDSFKGSLTSKEVCLCIESGFKKIFPSANIIKIPLADGGEGTIESITSSRKNSKIIYKKVIGPLGNKINSCFAILPDKIALIEMAKASGLTLVPLNKRNPLITTTFGVGELIKESLNYNCKKIIIGIGGSATNDGGAGCVQALGVKLLDDKNNEIGFGGGELNKIRKIDISNLDKRIKKTKIIIASDVQNPLCGKFGASIVYSPQKGATPDIAKKLDKNLCHFAKIIKKYIKKDIKNIPGSGAAGGLGGGLIAFLSAEIKSGIEIIAEITQLEKKLKDANLVITGEGKIDEQTSFGKLPVGVAKFSKKYNIPTIAICGSIISGAEKFLDKGIDSIFSIVTSPMTEELAMKNAKELLTRTSEQIARVIKLKII